MFDESKLPAASQRVASLIFTRWPDFRTHASLDEVDRHSLLLIIPSPTGDAKRSIVLWMHEETELSLEFAGTHTHAGCVSLDADKIWDESGILDLCAALLKDEVVVILDSDAPQTARFVRLDDKDALLEEITFPGASERLLIRSWSGSADRTFNLATFR